MRTNFSVLDLESKDIFRKWRYIVLSSPLFKELLRASLCNILPSRWNLLARYHSERDVIDILDCNHSTSGNVKQTFCQMKSKHTPPTHDRALPATMTHKLIMGEIGWLPQITVDWINCVFTPPNAESNIRVFVTGQENRTHNI